VGTRQWCQVGVRHQSTTPMRAQPTRHRQVPKYSACDGECDARWHSTAVGAGVARSASVRTNLAGDDARHTRLALCEKHQRGKKCGNAENYRKSPTQRKPTFVLESKVNETKISVKHNKESHLRKNARGMCTLARMCRVLCQATFKIKRF
jgi:hypothetical protein